MWRAHLYSCENLRIQLWSQLRVTLTFYSITLCRVDPRFWGAVGVAYCPCRSSCYRVYILQLLASLLLFGVHWESALRKTRQNSMWNTHFRHVPIVSGGTKPLPVVRDLVLFFNCNSWGEAAAQGEVLSEHVVYMSWSCSLVWRRSLLGLQHPLVCRSVCRKEDIYQRGTSIPDMNLEWTWARISY